MGDESERYNLLLLERFPRLAQRWRAVDGFRCDPAGTGSIVFYNDVLLDTLPAVIEAAAEGEEGARSELSGLMSFAEELAAEPYGVEIVEHGMAAAFTDAAVDFWDVVGMMGPRTRELFDLRWGSERTPRWLAKRRKRERLGVLGFRRRRPPN